MVRLAVLAVRVEEEAERLARNLRLSNAERAELVALPRVARCVEPEMTVLDAKAALYRLGPRVYRGAVLLAWSAAPAPLDDERWGRLFGLPDEWEVPTFPLKGADLLDLGLSPGPGVGEVLDALEQQWIESDFVAGRDTLLAWARELIAQKT